MSLLASTNHPKRLFPCVLCVPWATRLNFYGLANPTRCTHKVLCLPFTALFEFHAQLPAIQPVLRVPAIVAKDENSNLRTPDL